MIKNSNESFSTPSDVEEEESLTLKKVNNLQPFYESFDFGDRPKANLIDLMHWVKKHFAANLKDQNKLNSFIHNRIIIDGQFLKFCELNDVTVSCLIKDSFVSWKTDNNFEKFFAQGVFLIKSKHFEFLHSALFHKGNQNEDEISFFVLASENNYDKYLKFRNSFDAWVMQRDRGNLHIRVVESEDIPYTRDHTWEDLFLPESIKSDVRQLVEGFLSSKDFYNSKKIPWKRGVLLYGPPGNGKTSIIRTIISNYNFKPVTIAPGANDEMIREAFSYAEEQSPSLLYFEDLDSLLERVDISSFLNLIDGISARNGMLIMATANDIKKLKANVTSRPSRFDRKFEIPLPDFDMCLSYLKKWFGTTISSKKCKELADISFKNEFSYAYLKELYISSMFEAIAHNRKAPTENDIEKAKKSLMKDKNLSFGNKINTDKYFDQ